ncbi:hypothetical protein AGABI1DRAFT_68132 [Agaricus bisporus var. burnettii JB137-S8]|uniref:Uncharacterized protein n=1 Tax=Agaricus bisporus var. burnettii (strain JB137-S8 / ATCC MYA-4627 / FGSC 10392) TaxID=597362 RepID=K5X3R7_AGABU|nr:uncharacterized protein AGABI1DRAFT_68132 [Agaricus bisporus var. burnettii JB137-S8]EKM82481.1 hypothetical protein AGABI1DRAFT_68132 [Agaricus bisporus var. burnettii JB137-S8]
MSVSLSIHPSTDRLDMYGEPKVTSAYSLSGYISISLSPSSSFFSRRRTARYLLQSLSLTFDGQTEIFTPIIGYSAVRLCSVTRGLVSSEDPLELSNEGQEDSEATCVWNIIFDITIPGWLPATSSLGREQLGVTYGLYATAKLLDLDGNRNKPWGFSTLCVPFLSNTKTVSARRAVEIERFAAPPALGDCAVGNIRYQVSNLRPPVQDDAQEQRKFPSDVLENIQVVLSLPEYVDMCQTEMTVSLEMKMNELEEEERKRLRVLDISLTPNQVEICRSQPSRNYLTRCPLPPEEQQHPNMMLLNPSAIGAIYEINVLPSLPERCHSAIRTFSLLSSKESGQFKPSDEQTCTSPEDATGLPSYATDWKIMEMTFPLARPAETHNDWEIPKVIRPSGSTPLFVVHHELVVSVTCAYTFPDSQDVAQEKLKFTIPLTLGKSAPPPPQPPLLPSVSRANVVQSTNAPSLPVVEPYAWTLPVYSQLYHSNGQERVDYSVPLPLYTPPHTDDESDGAGHYSARRMSILEVGNVGLEENIARMKDIDASRPVEMDNVSEVEDEETTPLLEACAT